MKKKLINFLIYPVNVLMQCLYTSATFFNSMKKLTSFLLYKAHLNLHSQ